MMSAQGKIKQDTGMPGWLELYDLSLHGDMVSRTPSGAFIRGMIAEDQKFSPTSEILGRAISKPEKVGQNPGWVELEYQQFHSDIEAVALRPPYAHGLRDQNGYFYPDEPYTIVRSS